MIDVFINDIRDKLISSVHSNNIHTLLPNFVSKNNIAFPTCAGLTHQLPFHRESLLNYYYLVRLCEIYGSSKSKVVRPQMNVMVDETTQKTTGIDNNLASTAILLFYNDVARANIFVSTVAWLTIDEFRWHKTENFTQTPEDLSYGMILQYPDLVVPVAKLVADIDRAEALGELEPGVRATIERMAFKDVANNHPRVDALCSG